MSAAITNQVTNSQGVKTQTIGVADFHVSRQPDVSLVTYALGSCIGLMVYDPVVRVGGMLHYMLPDSTLDLEKAAKTPAMFADVGIPLLFRSCYELGAEKKRMTVYAAGGAQVMGTGDLFEIGKRNQLALKKILWKAGVLLRGCELGGTLSRTIRLDLNSGRILMRTGGSRDEVLHEGTGISASGAAQGVMGEAGA
jgi:chemotaxis protein CheD